ncbi:hypothetical protein YC2023_112153 [Brassica napus]
MEAVFWLLDFSTHPLSSGGYLPPPSPVFVYRRRYRFLSTVAVTGYPLPLPFPVLLVRCLFRLQMNLRIFNCCNRSRSLKGGWINGPWTLYRSLAQVIRSLSPLKIGYKYRKLAVQAKKKKLASLRYSLLHVHQTCAELTNTCMAHPINTGRLAFPNHKSKKPDSS